MRTPEGWKVAKLPEIATLEMGETLIAKDLTGDGLPVFSAGRDPKPWGFTSRSKKSFVRGTIVLGARGTIGFPRLPDYERFISTQTTIAVSPSPSAIPAFLAYALAACEFDSVTAKQAIPMLTITALRDLAFALPPLPEQKKIAAILSSVDEAIEATQAVVEQLQVVKKAMMGELLTKGIPGRHSRFKKTEIGEVPEGWGVVRLGELLDGIDAGWSPKCESRPAREEEWGVLKTSAVTSGLYRDSENKALPANLVPRPEIEVKEGDVLLVRANGVLDLVGKSVFIRTTRERLMLSDKVLRLRSKPELLPDFLNIALGWDAIRRRLLARTGGSDMRNVSQASLRELPIALPAREEQKAIANAIGSIDERHAAEAMSLESLGELKSALLSVLLTGEVRVRVEEEEARCGA